MYPNIRIPGFSNGPRRGQIHCFLRSRLVARFGFWGRRETGGLHCGTRAIFDSVQKKSIGLIELLEVFFRMCAVVVLVGMPLERELSVSPPDLLRGSVFTQTENRAMVFPVFHSFLSTKGGRILMDL